MPTDTLPAVAPHEQLAHPLHRLRSGIRTFVALDILLFLAVAATAFFWLGVGFDYGLFKAGGLDVAQQTHWALRGSVYGLLALALALVVAVRVRRMLTRDFSYPSLAMVLEKRHPELLADRLITAVELADVAKAERQGYSAAMIEQTIAEARERVGRVNVRDVFNWRRLWQKAAVVAALTVLGLGTAAAAYAATARDFRPAPFAHRLTDVVTIWGERNVLMRNTPWPRRSHLELVDFPASGELRVGKDAGPPRIRARAYKWVVAAPGTYTGWRPLAWADMDRGFGIAVPASADVADAATAGATRTVELAGLTVDDVEAQVGAAHPAVEAAFARLDALAADPWMSRSVRRLAVPRELGLAFVGLSGKTRGEVNLAREPSGEFAGDVAGIAENTVTFTVSGEDFRTPPQTIQLIPKPVLVDLRRDEYAPAYLYHAAPVDGPPAAAGQEPVTGQAALRGLRQRFADKKISLTGDKSVFSVAAGTELEIAATADKKLKKLAVTAKTGKVPAVVREAATEADGFDTFGISLRGPNAVAEATEFEVAMTDFDGVLAKRSILIQVTEDQPPTVELVVEALRKVGTAYMVTPVVRVPFSTDSAVKDDTGLSRVEYELNYTKLESEVVQKLQAQLAAGLATAVGSPVANWGSPAVAAWNDALYRQFGNRGEAKTYRKHPLARFQQDYAGLPRETYARLLQKLDQPLPPEQADVLRQVKLKDPKFDYFDLAEAAPGLLAASPGDVQARYRMELNLVATDVNAEVVGKGGAKVVGKTGQNAEPLQFLIVSEQELLVEISKDEETLSVKLDELYKRVVDAQTKLAQEVGYLRSPTKEQIENSRIRALDILQDVLKSKEQLAGVLVECERLHREMAANQFAANILERYTKDDGTGIIDRARRILDGTEPKGNFPAAEGGLAGFQTALAAGAAPDEAATTAARTEMARLIAALDDLLKTIERGADRAKLVQRLLDLIRETEEVKGGLNAVWRDQIDRLKQPAITAIKPVSVKVGGTVNVKHAIDWKLYDKGELYLRIDTPKESGLKVPAELVLKDDFNDFTFDVTAGPTPGNHVLKLVPAVGKPVEVQIVVTKE